jgi:hypothetical protein
MMNWCEGNRRGKRFCGESEGSERLYCRGWRPKMAAKLLDRVAMTEPDFPTPTRQEQGNRRVNICYVSVLKSTQARDKALRRGKV